MIQVNFSPFLEAEVERKQSELRHEMRKIRLADSVTHNYISAIDKPAKALAKLGKSLILLGTSLEQRYGKISLQDSSDDSSQSTEDSCQGAIL